MKKVLLVCDGNHFPQGAFELLTDNYANKPLRVTGVFLSSIEYSKLWFYPIERSGDLVSEIIAEDERAIASSIKYFNGLCEQHLLEHNIHVHENITLPALINDTRFADLMLLSSEVFFSNLGEEQPNSYTQTILHKTECPVLLVPETYRRPSQILIAYDGSQDAVFAAKQFSLLFPEWAMLETTIIHFSEQATGVPDEQHIKEFTQSHFPNSKLQSVASDSQETLNTLSHHGKDCLLVTGAFGRTTMSRLFNKSFAWLSLHNHQMPVFIAHH